MICSLRNSASSSQSTRLFLALPSLSTSNVSASSIGYASMTFAPSQMYTSSVGGTSALANSVSLSSKVVSIGSVSSWCCCQPAASRSLGAHARQARPGYILSSSLGTGPSPASFGCLVSCLSGPQLSFACSTPCTDTSWCCLLRVNPRPSPKSPPGLSWLATPVAAGESSILAHRSPESLCIDSRDHLLELPQRGLRVGARGDIVLDPVDERRIGYASWVGGGVLAPAGKSSPRQRPARKSCLVFLLGPGHLPQSGCFPFVCHIDSLY